MQHFYGAVCSGDPFGEVIRKSSDRQLDLLVRTVGYAEYTAALRHFDELVPKLSLEELAAVEKIVASRDELAITSGLSNRLLAIDPSVIPVGGRQTERRGLSWLTALARIELGAMESTFDNAPNNDLVSPNSFDFQAFAELTFDGGQDHFFSITADKSVTQIRRSIPTERVWANLNHIRLAKALTISTANSMTNRENAAFASLIRRSEILDKLMEQHVLILRVRNSETEASDLRPKYFIPNVPLTTSNTIPVQTNSPTSNLPKN